MDITAHRLHNLLITNMPFDSPGGVVRHLGAVQSQEYASAKWAIGLRLPATSNAAIEDVFNKAACFVLMCCAPPGTSCIRLT
ncbi:MAG: hypothetical protein H7257_07455 [Taibaiella sp.]|nr:hypothetical protein [Taibaiella sp.]